MTSYRTSSALRRLQPEKEPTAEEKYEASLPPVKDWQKPQPEPQQSQRDAIREAMKNLPQLKVGAVWSAVMGPGFKLGLVLRHVGVLCGWNFLLFVLERNRNVIMSSRFMFG